jgi:hypothetical protein
MVCAVSAMSFMSSIFFASAMSFMDGMSTVNCFLFKVRHLFMQLVLGVIHMFVMSGVIGVRLVFVLIRWPLLHFVRRVIHTVLTMFR